MLRQVSVQELHAAPSQPVPWVCNGVASRGSVSVLAGRPGEGKSWLALGLCHGVGRGAVVAGIPCEFGSALYLDGENGQAEMTRRVQLLGIRYGVEFLFTEGPFDFVDNAPGISHYISSLSPTLVVLDGFRSLWSGDENDSRAVTAAFGVLQELAENYDVAILVLHHMSKVGGYRGSGAIAAAPQILIEIEADGPERVMRWEKCRIGPAPYQHKFSIDGGTEAVRLVTR